MENDRFPHILLLGRPKKKWLDNVCKDYAAEFRNPNKTSSVEPFQYSIDV